MWSQPEPVRSWSVYSQLRRNATRRWNWAGSLGRMSAAWPTAYGLAGRLQQQAAAIDHVGHDLQRGLVVGILLAVNEFFQREVITESCVFH